MNLAIILAAGTSERITNYSLPKQFIEINQQPLIIYSLKTFLSISTIDKIIVIVHSDWKKHTSALLIEHQLDERRIDIITGGNSRNQSLLNGVNYLNEHFNLDAQDIILTHDAARALVTPEIILNNISVCRQHNACNTAIKSVDTIFLSNDETWLSKIPERKLMYCSQTPQTFKWHILKDVYLHQKQVKELFENSDASTLVLEAGYTIKIVKGNQNNFKVTNNEDLLILKNKYK